MLVHVRNSAHNLSMKFNPCLRCHPGWLNLHAWSLCHDKVWYHQCSAHPGLPHGEQTATYKCVSPIIPPGEVWRSVWMMLAHSRDSAHDLSMEFSLCLVNHPDWQNLLLNATCMDCVPWQGMISIVFCSLGLSPRWWHLRYSKLYLWEKSDIM